MVRSRRRAPRTTAFVGADVADAKRLGGGRSIGSQRQMTPAPSPSTPNAAPSAPERAPGGGPARRRRAAAAAAVGHVALARPHRRHRRGHRPRRAAVALRPCPRLREPPARSCSSSAAALFVIRMLLAARAAARRPMQYAGRRPTASSRACRDAVRARARDERRNAPPAASPLPAGVRSRAVHRAGEAAVPAAAGRLRQRRPQGAGRSDDARDVRGNLGATSPSARRTSQPRSIASTPTSMDVVTEGNQHWMSVRFTGLLREDGTRAAEGVRRDVEPRQAGRRLVGMAAGRDPAGA